MTNDKKMTKFTMVDVIQRKIDFINTNTIFDKTEYLDNDEGELLAYNEMLTDVKVMREDDFVSKYLTILKKLAIQFENEEFKNESEIDKMSGYNNAIVSVLKCINPIYQYDLED
ncbi:hypothetical protein SFC65_19780 [Priestia filamentosa]|uniref:hypothetical protein n=1 Tax=Priestia filamentosa TaxID=1402861 RepID=UPI0039820D34